MVHKIGVIVTEATYNLGDFLRGQTVTNLVRKIVPDAVITIFSNEKPEYHGMSKLFQTSNALRERSGELMNQSNFYDEEDHTSPSFIREVMLEFIAKALPSNDMQKCLDLGCGDGSFAIKAKEIIKAHEIYGVDSSTVAINDSAKKGVIAIKLDLNFERLPFPSNSFDVILAVELIEHLTNPDNMLKEAYRVLKPHGLFFLSTPNLASWVNRILIMMGYMPYFSEPSLNYLAGFLCKEKRVKIWGGHLRLYTLKAVKELLRFYGFKIAKVWGSHGGYENRILNIVDKGFKQIPSLASGIIVLAKK